MKLTKISIIASALLSGGLMAASFTTGISGISSSTHTANITDADTTLGLSWTAPSVSGGTLSKYWVKCDNTASTEITSSSQTGVSQIAGSATTTSCTGLTTGDWYFHIKAILDDGTAGLTYHSNKFVVDATPPTASISLSTGTYTGAQSVTLSSNDSAATIKYTLDGTTPSASNGTTYSTAISVSTSATLKAVAIDSVGNVSSVKSATYTIQELSGVPSLSGVPVGKTASTSATVTVSGTSVDYYRYKIYTLDSSGVVTADSGWYTSSGNGYAVSTPISITGLAEGHYKLSVQGSTSQTTFSASNEKNSSSWQVDTTAPVLTLTESASGIDGSQTFTASTDGSGDSIYYELNSTDGSFDWASVSVATPSTSSNRYSSPLSFESNTSINVYAVDDVGNAASVQNKTFTFNPPTPGKAIIGDVASTTNESNLTINVSGSGVTKYKWALYSYDSGTYTLVDSNNSYDLSIYTPITLTDLSDANYSLYAYGYKSAWQDTNDSYKIFSVDTTAPTLSVAIKVDTNTTTMDSTTAQKYLVFNSDANVTFSVSETGGSARYESSTGESCSTTALSEPTSSSNTASSAISLDSTTCFKVAPFDGAGNGGSSVSFKVYWNVAPSISTIKISPENNITTNSTVILVPTITKSLDFESLDYNWTINNETNSTGKVFAQKFGAGTHTVALKATDSYGKYDTSTVTFVVNSASTDTVVPSVDTASASTGTTLNFSGISDGEVGGSTINVTDTDTNITVSSNATAQKTSGYYQISSDATNSNGDTLATQLRLYTNGYISIVSTKMDDSNSSDIKNPELHIHKTGADVVMSDDGNITITLPEVSGKSAVAKVDSNRKTAITYSDNTKWSRDDIPGGLSDLPSIIIIDDNLDVNASIGVNSGETFNY